MNFWKGFQQITDSVLDKLTEIIMKNQFREYTEKYVIVEKSESFIKGNNVS